MLFDSPGLVEQPVKLAMHFHHELSNGQATGAEIKRVGGGGVGRWLVGLNDCSRLADLFQIFYFTFFKILYSAV